MVIQHSKKNAQHVGLKSLSNCGGLEFIIPTVSQNVVGLKEMLNNRGSEYRGPEYRGSEYRGSEYRGSEYRGLEYRGSTVLKHAVVHPQVSLHTKSTQ